MNIGSATSPTYRYRVLVMATDKYVGEGTNALLAPTNLERNLVIATVLLSIVTTEAKAT